MFKNVLKKKIIVKDLNNTFNIIIYFVLNLKLFKKYLLYLN